MTNKDQLFLIDRFCDEFESNLQQGSAVNIEQVLDTAKQEAGDPKIAEVLFPELIALQILYSEDRDAEAEILKSKFPERSIEIESAGDQCSLLGTIINNSLHTEIDGTNTSSKDAPSIRRLGERFENLEHFASGGLGDVYLGYDNSVRRRVAVKLLKPGLVSNSEAKRRFEDEVAITGMLEHPGIVPIYDSGMSNDGQPFYAMRWLEGQTLKAAIEQLHTGVEASSGNAKSPEATQRSLLHRLNQVCDAVSFAHDRGVIHRDLKPENILLGQYGETIVIDWGLARRDRDANSSNESSDRTLGNNSQTDLVEHGTSSQNATQIGSVLGTPEYMSPEQASGDSSKIVKQSDVYSLGAILYCILTGTSPHRQKANSTKQRIAAAIESEFPTAKEFNAATPAALSAICERAMHVDPGSRYQSPAALADDVKNWLNDQPVSASPDNALGMFSRFLRKNLHWSAAGAATLVAITVGSLIAASVINSQSAELAKRKTEAEELATKEAESATDARNANLDSLAYVNFMNRAFEKLRSENESKNQASKNVQLKDLINVLDSELNNREDQISQTAKLRVIGNMVTALNAVGENQKALEKSREFLDLAIELDDDSFSLSIAEGKGALAYSLVGNEKFEAALLLADETLAMIHSTEFLPNEKQRIDHIENSLQTSRLRSLRELQRWSEAVSLREDRDPWLKELDISALPKSSAELSLVSVYIHDRSLAGNMPDLLEWQQKLYYAQKKNDGAKNVKSLSTLHRLALAVAREQGDAAALPYREDLVELATEVLGANHRNTMVSRENLALACYNLGIFDRSIELYSQLHKDWLKKGADAKARRNKRLIGEAQLYSGQEQQALETLQAVVEQAAAAEQEDPGSSLARFRWLIALLENGQVDKAIAAIDEEIESKAMADAPEKHLKYFVLLQFAYVLNGDFDSALLQGERIPNEQNQKNSILVIQIAEALCGSERWDEASVLLEKLLEWSPHESQSPVEVDALKCHKSNAKGLLAGIISKSDPDRAEKLYLESISEFEAGYRVAMQTTRVERPHQKFILGLASFYEAGGEEQQADRLRKKIEKLTDGDPNKSDVGD